MNDAQQLLEALLRRVGPEQRAPLVPGDGEQLVAAGRITDPNWLAGQLRRRGERWRTDQPRVLATLWWYSASAWLVGPTLTSLALGNRVFSADLDDLTLHWLPDSRITGATSSRILGTASPIDGSASSLRGLYEHVIPAIAEHAGIAERPLWAIAADSIATRLLAIGQAIGEVDRVAALLRPLTDGIGDAMPSARYTRHGTELTTLRTSCCLLYLAPDQSKCDLCPRRRARP